MNAVALKNELFDRIANLVSMDVRPKQIARATGLTEDRVSQICQMDEFRDVLAELETGKFEQIDLLNKGWDGIEEEALGTVLEVLTTNPDADYALKAAAIANKAIRRGRDGNQPIQGGGIQAAVINLSQIYVNKLQLQSENAAKAERPNKIVDAMPLSIAEKFLGKSVKPKNPVATSILHVGNADIEAVGEEIDAMAVGGALDINDVSRFNG